MIYHYSDGEREDVEDVVSIHVDDGQRHYITKRDGSGLILPSPDKIEVKAKSGRSAFAI